MKLAISLGKISYKTIWHLLNTIPNILHADFQMSCTPWILNLVCLTFWFSVRVKDNARVFIHLNKGNLYLPRVSFWRKTTKPQDQSAFSKLFSFLTERAPPQNFHRKIIFALVVNTSCTLRANKFATSHLINQNVIGVMINYSELVAWKKAWYFLSTKILLLSTFSKSR